MSNPFIKFSFLILHSYIKTMHALEALMHALAQKKEKKF